ncbi:MAG: helix-turn-helix transcriptional regulator [Microbacterium sp.]|uniref:helix-turn-helix domain-containing protein n=1 Tax=Microbacterium sp. TaxID=51671 RepID=UPI0039E482BE
MEAHDLSGLVRRVRRLADLSQRDLAERVGVAQSHISLDVYAAPERITYRMILRGGDLFPDAWFHRRPDRDRIRQERGRSCADEQPTVSSRAHARSKGHRARRRTGAVTVV